jgi:hypothetical protein
MNQQDEKYNTLMRELNDKKEARLTYLKRATIEYKGEKIHFTHFGGERPEADQHESYNRMGTMLGRKGTYQGGATNMMPPTSLPEGQKEWTVDSTLDAPPTWGRGNWQFPSTHKKYTPFRFNQQQDNEQRKHDTIPQKYANPQPTSIQIQHPTKWMNQTWQQTITDPTKINARHLQSKGTNEGSSLLISMVVKRMQHRMGTTEPDEPPSKVYGTPLQFHSVPTLIKTLKNDTILQELHYTITDNHYPPPIEALSPSAIPTLFQHNEHPYTAMEDIESIMPQELKTIIVTYCERFYPQATKQTLEALQHTTEEEINQILQTPMALRKMIKRTGIEFKFNPPTISKLTTPRREASTQSKTSNPDSHDPIQTIGLNTTTFRSQTQRTNTSGTKRDKTLINTTVTAQAT